MTEESLQPMMALSVELGTILGVSLLLSLIQHYFISWLLKRDHVAKNQWAGAFLSALGKPLLMMIWVVGATWSLEAINECIRITDDISLFVIFRQVGLILAVSWILQRWKQNIEAIFNKRFEDKAPKERATVRAVARFINVLIVVTAGLMVLDTLGVPLHTLLAFGGAGAVASGLAAKDIVANFFGGMMIFLTRPFTVGDWINSPDKTIEGTVVSIGWYMTCIKGFDRRPIYVPNALFSSLVVVNPSRMSHRRIKQNVGVRYGDIHQLTGITEDIEKMLKEHPEIDTRQPLMVHFMEFGPYSLDINIYTFTKTTNWQRWREVQQDVLLKVAEIIHKRGADIAFPTQTLNLSHEPKSHQGRIN